MLLAALVPALAAATALSLWRPSLALRIWIALLPVQLDTGGSLGLRLAPADVLLAGMIVAILARKLPHRRLSLRVDAVLVVALLLLVWLVLSLPQTVAELGYVPRSVLVNKLVGFALLAAVYWMTLESHSTAKEAIKALDWYRTAGSLWNLVGIGAFTIWQRFGVLSPFVYGGTRLCGLLVDPNAYGGFLVSVFMLEITRLSHGIRSWTVTAANVGVLFYGILLTSSRSSWLALVLGVAGLFFVLRGRARIRLVVTGVFLAAEVALHFIVLSPSSWELATRTPQVEARVSLIEEATSAVSSSPIQGIGLGVFPTRPGSGGLIVHSTYFWLLAETGIPGLVLLLLVLGLIFWQCRKSLQLGGAVVQLPATALSAAVVAWLGLMVGIEALYQRHFWFLAALLGSLYLWVLRESKATQPEIR